MDNNTSNKVKDSFVLAKADLWSRLTREQTAITNKLKTFSFIDRIFNNVEYSKLKGRLYVYDSIIEACKDADYLQMCMEIPDAVLAELGY